MTDAATLAPTTSRPFTITRIFPAPRDALFRAFTEPARMARWWGPKGFAIAEWKGEPKAGGTYLYCLRSPNGTEMWGRLRYREVTPERIVAINSFSDPDGNVTRHPMSPTWPRETLSVIEFAERDGGTAVTVTWTPHEPTAEERETFDGAHESMRGGWTGTFDQLEEYLRSEQDCPMKVEPRPEHAWLQRIVGEWTFESECQMGPDQPAMKSSGTETVRGIGGLWVQGEGRGEMPGGGPATMIVTLGYDPRKERFVGTFVGSMMTHLWVYERSLDASGGVLTLDTEGPNFGPGGGMARYQDIVEIRDDDHRVLRSRMLGQDGEWRDFMTAHYRRKR